MEKKRYQVEIANKGIKFTCSENDNILIGSEKAGNNLLVGCRNGGCGYCRIKIISGEVEKMVMSARHASPEEQEQGIVLACRVKPLSDIVCDFLGLKESW